MPKDREAAQKDDCLLLTAREQKANQCTAHQNYIRQAQFSWRWWVELDRKTEQTNNIHKIMNYYRHDELIITLLLVTVEQIILER